MTAQFYTRVREENDGTFTPLAHPSCVAWPPDWYYGPRKNVDVVREMIELGTRVHCANWYEV